MGHVKVTWRPDLRSPGLEMGATLKPLTAGEIAAQRKRRTFGPEEPEGCVAECDAMQVTNNLLNEGGSVTGEYLIWPSPESVLCEGDCLEWAMELTGFPGVPNITMESAEDCVGVVVTLNDTEANLDGGVVTMTPTLNGEPFCAPVELGLAYECNYSFVSWEVPDNTFPAFPGGYTGVQRTLFLHTESDPVQCLPPGLTFVLVGGGVGSCGLEDVMEVEVLKVPPPGGALNEFVINIWSQYPECSYAGAELNIQAYFEDPDAGTTAYGDPIVLVCEE